MTDVTGEERSRVFHYMLLPNVGMYLQVPHSATTLKTIIITFTVVRISDLTES
jgi:hypothetical protein